MNAGIYLIVNTLTGNYYLGSSINMVQRWSDHRKELRGRRHPNMHLQRAWDKYTETAFEFRVLVRCHPARVRTVERTFLEALPCYYNMTRAVNMQYVHSTEARAKMSRALKGQAKPWLRGRRQDPARRAKLSAALKGRTITPQAREKLRISARARNAVKALKPGAFAGRKHTAETRAKMSATHTRMGPSQKFLETVRSDTYRAAHKVRMRTSIKFAEYHERRRSGTTERVCLECATIFVIRATQAKRVRCDFCRMERIRARDRVRPRRRRRTGGIST